MQRGTSARIVSPPEYAYGNQDNGNDLVPEAPSRLPADSTVIFDIEVVYVKPGKK